MTKIMLVEDDNNLREIYGARLQAEGYVIVSAKDGEEALAMAVREKPDLIISDVMMPKISGFDMLDILRQTAETKNTKVVMMTALSQKEDEERGQKLGADRYLVKSQVTLEDVVRVVGEVLSGQPAPETNPYSAPHDEEAIEAAEPEPVEAPVVEEPAAEVEAPTEPEVAAEPDTAPVAMTVAIAADKPAQTNDPTPANETPTATATAAAAAVVPDPVQPAPQPVIVDEPIQPTPEPVVVDPAPEAPATPPAQTINVDVIQPTTVEPITPEDTPPPKVSEPTRPAPPKPVKTPIIPSRESKPAKIQRPPEHKPAPKPVDPLADAPKPEPKTETEPESKPEPFVPEATVEPEAAPEPKPAETPEIVQPEVVEPEAQPTTEEAPEGPQVAPEREDETHRQRVIQPLNDIDDKPNIIDLLEKEMAKEAAANLSGSVIPPDTVAGEQKIVDDQINNFVSENGEYKSPTEVEAEQPAIPVTAEAELKAEEPAQPASKPAPENAPSAEAAPAAQAPVTTPPAPAAEERTSEEKQRLTDLAL